MNLDASLDQLGLDPTAPMDVAELALRLALDEYPGLDVEAYLNELNGMGHEARAYVRGGLEEKTAGLCRYLFHEMGFRGNVQNYYDPANSYLNEVIDRRTGLPITLSVVAIAVGRRAGLSVTGVGLPGHFIARAAVDGEEVLFDPFHGGRRLNLTDCENLVRQVTGADLPITPDFLQTVPPGPLLTRLLGNLKGVYMRQGDYARCLRVVERLRQLNPRDVVQRRDLGVCMLRDGRPGAAIAHLEAYLASAADDDDAFAVREMLQRARGEVAKWN